MNELRKVVKNAKEFGLTVGQDAGILLALGASETQAQAYVKNAQKDVPIEYRLVFLLHVERGAKDYQTKLNDPLFRAHVLRLADLIVSAVA